MCSKCKPSWISGAFFALLSLIGCSGPPADVVDDGDATAALSGTFPSGDSLQATIGQGFDTATGTLRSACVSGTTTTDPREEATFDITSDMTREQAFSKLGIVASVKANARFIKFRGNVAIARAATEDDMSLAIVAQRQHKKDRLHLIDGATLRTLVSPGSSSWNSRCGDEAIVEKTIGSRFTLVLRISAVSRSVKQSLKTELQARFKGGSSVQTSLEALQAKFSGQFSVAVHAFQEGGDASEINRIVQGAAPPDELAGATAVVHCSEGSLPACETFFTNALSWMSSDALSDSEAAHPVDLFYGTQPWAELGVDRNFDLPVNAILARLKTDTLVETNTQCYERAQELVAMSAVTDDFRKQLSDIQATCRQNVYILDATTVRFCYDRLIDPQSSTQIAACLDNVKPENLAANGYTNIDTITAMLADPPTNPPPTPPSM